MLQMGRIFGDGLLFYDSLDFKRHTFGGFDLLIVRKHPLT